MKNVAVMIIDLDKLDNSTWKMFWKGSGISIHRIKETSIDRVTEFVDRVQEDELNETNIR